MSTRQREPNTGMVKACAQPRRGRVTRRAGLRESGLHVVRIRGRIVILGVAAVAISAGALVLAVFVAGVTVQRRVRARQGEPGNLPVVKLGSRPRHDCVAILACNRKTHSLMIRRGTLVRLRMAGVALSRKSFVSPAGPGPVTRLTVHRGMAAHQRKPVLVQLDVLQRYAPALYSVALLANRSHLAAVYIRVAVGALGAHVLEHQAGVALRAPHARVHATQRKLRLVMIELRYIPDRLPCSERMAVLTCHVHISMRTARYRALGRLGAGR